MLIHPMVERRADAGMSGPVTFYGVVCIFPNEAAVNPLIGALLLEQSDEWRCSVLPT